MTDNVRKRQIQNCKSLCEKALEQIGNGEIMKGMKNFKRSVCVVPPSKELSDFGKRLRKTVEEHSTKLGGGGL